MKKITSYILILFTCILTGCSGLPKQTYTYNTEDDLSVSILKTKVYDDKLVVKFSGDAFSSVEAIRCYDENFEAILEDVEFKGEDNVLTIYTEEADKISGYWVSADLGQEPLCVSIEESKGYSMLYDFFMSEDLMSFECSLMDGEFTKVEGE